MRGRAETVRSAAVWADTTRPYPVGQEGSKQRWISVSESHTNRELLHSWTQVRFRVPILKMAPKCLLPYNFRISDCPNHDPEIDRFGMLVVLSCQFHFGCVSCPNCPTPSRVHRTPLLLNGFTKSFFRGSIRHVKVIECSRLLARFNALQAAPERSESGR
jgi:hypothetical protein